MKNIEIFQIKCLLCGPSFTIHTVDQNVFLEVIDVVESESDAKNTIQQRFTVVKAAVFNSKSNSCEMRENLCFNHGKTLLYDFFGIRFGFYDIDYP